MFYVELCKTVRIEDIPVNASIYLKTTDVLLLSGSSFDTEILKRR